MKKGVNDRMQEKFLKQKTKRPKGKPLKNFDYKSAAVGGIKYKKEKGAEQKILDMIITGMKDDEQKKYSDIILYLKQQGKKIGDEDARFYELLANNIHNNVKINLNDLINSKNFLFSLNIFDTDYPLRMNVFSNDKLVWLSIVYQHCKNKFKDYLTFLLLDNMEISIRTLIAEVERDYLKGFYIDFSNLFSFIGCNLLTDKEQESFITAGNPEAIYTVIKDNAYCRDAKIEKNNCFHDEFKLNGTDYIYNYVENGICFVCQKDKVNDAKTGIKNVKHIEGKTEKDEKLKVKSTGKNKPFCYISQKIKLVNFSPSVIDVSNYFDTSFGITSEIELNKFEEEMYKQFIAKDDFKISEIIDVKHFAFLDNFEAIMQFIIIEYNVRLRDYKFKNEETNKKFQEFLKKCKELFDFYTENKTYFKALKSTCSSLIRFYLRFYDSFGNKINIDTSKSLYKTCEKVEAELNDIKMNDTIRNVIQTLSANFKGGSFNYTYTYFLNAINLESHVSILKKIKEALNDIIRGNYTYLLKDLMEAGKAVYGITLGSATGDTMTREMRSPSSFMGNLYGGDMRTIEAESERLAKSDMKREVEASEYGKIVSLSYGDKEAFKRGIALLSEEDDGSNYDFNKKSYSTNFDKYWKMKIGEIKGIFKDDTLMNKIKIYGTVCFFLNAKQNPASYGVDGVVSDLRKLYKTYGETKKARRLVSKFEKEEKLTKESISPELTYEIMTGGKGIEGSMTSSKAIELDNELLKKAGKDLFNLLMEHGFMKEAADAFVKNNTANELAKYGITIAGLINYIAGATVDSPLKKEFFNDNAMEEMIKLSNETNEIKLKLPEPFAKVDSFGPRIEDKKEEEKIIET